MIRAAAFDVEFSGFKVVIALPFALTDGIDGENDEPQMKSGLVRDVCVVAMNDRRQYLAAAIAFNDEGKKKFEGQKKFDINMFFHNFLTQYFENVVIPKKWRFLDELPSDLQGKHKKLEIQALFTKNE